MMKSIFSFTLLMAVAFPALAQTSPDREAGRIENIEYIDPHHTLLTSEGHVKRDAKYVKLQGNGLTILYPGDKIEVLIPNLKVTYSLVGEADLKIVTSSSSPAPIPDIASLKPNLCVMLDCVRVMKVQKSRRTSIARPTRSHGEEATTFTYSDLLPKGDQYLPFEYKTLSVIWSGGTASVRAGASVAKGNHQFATLGSPLQNKFSLKVSAENVELNENDTLSWRIIRVNTPPPLPEGIASTVIISSDGDRLERALFLLQPEYVQWHLFAISEIAELRDHSITAEMAWRQVVSGNYPAP